MPRDRGRECSPSQAGRYETTVKPGDTRRTQTYATDTEAFEIRSANGATRVHVKRTQRRLSARLAPGGYGACARSGGMDHRGAVTALDGPVEPCSVPHRGSSSRYSLIRHAVATWNSPLRGALPVVPPSRTRFLLPWIASSNSARSPRAVFKSQSSPSHSRTTIRKRR